MDREEVIKGLERFKADFKPFCGNGADWKRVDDAIAVLKEQNSLMLALEQSNAVNGYLNAEVERLNGLLKEQEAVEPVTESSVYDPDTWFFVCGSCKKCVISPGDNFCRWCGQAVKWE